MTCEELDKRSDFVQYSFDTCFFLDHIYHELQAVYNTGGPTYGSIPRYKDKNTEREREKKIFYCGKFCKNTM